MRRALLFALGLPLLAGCDLIGRPAITEDFGAPYAIAVGANAASLDAPSTPLLTTTGRLIVVITYVGGCSNHLFSADYALFESQARVWITHTDPGDVCTERVREDHAFQLNPAIFTRPEVVFSTPDGDLTLTPTVFPQGP